MTSTLWLMRALRAGRDPRAEWAAARAMRALVSDLPLLVLALRFAPRRT